MSNIGTYVFEKEHGTRRVRATLRILDARLQQTLELFEIEVETETGLWPETYGDRRLADVFLRGCQVAFALSTAQHGFPGNVADFMAFGRRID